MEKIRTLEQLVDYLDRSIVWRRNELTIIHRLITSSPLPQGKRDALIRSGIALLYAHWEGFIREAATAYVSFVATRRLTYQELASNFVALAMKKQLHDARDTNKATVFTKVSDFFLTRLHERVDMSWEDSINTQSNLSSEVLKEILCTIGLDQDLFITKSKLIDVQLLKNRNGIAHGEFLLIDEEEFESLFTQILEMMRTLHNEISNAAILEKYRRHLP